MLGDSSFSSRELEKWMEGELCTSGRRAACLHLQDHHEDSRASIMVFFVILTGLFSPQEVAKSYLSAAAFYCSACRNGSCQNESVHSFRVCDGAHLHLV